MWNDPSLSTPVRSGLLHLCAALGRPGALRGTQHMHTLTCCQPSGAGRWARSGGVLRGRLRAPVACEQHAALSIYPWCLGQPLRSARRLVGSTRSAPCPRAHAAWAACRAHPQCVDPNVRGWPARAPGPAGPSEAGRCSSCRPRARPRGWCQRLAGTGGGPMAYVQGRAAWPRPSGGQRGRGPADRRRTAMPMSSVCPVPERRGSRPASTISLLAPRNMSKLSSRAL
mmetsp:Transcript_21915/g.73708  ORF Transcript_21915/g.73708 Transcript_21915/m.73708 type:complete len:227 (-) Transcript_21915:21-701(-)